MSAPKYAPKRTDGLKAYVVTKRSVWQQREWSRIEWAPSLADARRDYGWTREQHTTVTVRRASPADLDEATP